MSGSATTGTRDWSRRDVLAMWMVAGAGLSAHQPQRPSRPPAPPEGSPAPAFGVAEMQDLDQLDHLLWGAPSLEKGIAWMKERTGLEAMVGGRHPGQGTMNALLSLGPRRYLEIIGPDPEQPDARNPRIDAIRALTEPRLIGWAAGAGDLAAVAARARSAGLEVIGPVPGSRKRPDGTTLQWRALAIVQPQDPLLPFFIEWAPGSVASFAGCTDRLQPARVLAVLTIAGTVGRLEEARTGGPGPDRSAATPCTDSHPERRPASSTERLTVSPARPLL